MSDPKSQTIADIWAGDTVETEDGVWIEGNFHPRETLANGPQPISIPIKFGANRVRVRGMTTHVFPLQGGLNATQQ